MYVRVGKAGKCNSVDSDFASVLCGERIDLGLRTDSNNPTTRDGNRFGVRMGGIEREEFAEEYRVRSECLRTDRDGCLARTAK